jgi:hypothetical protein
MSNDEPAWYETEATARVEPAHLGRPMSEGAQVAQPMERLLPAEETFPAFRVGTVAPEGEWSEPLQPRTAAHVSAPLLQERLTEPEAEHPLTAARVSGPLLQERLTEPEAEHPLTAARVSGPLLQERLTEPEAEHPLTAARVSGPLLQERLTEPAQQAQPRTAETVAKRRVAGDDGGGSAGQGFKVDPEQYQAAVSPMLAAYEQVRSLYTSLSAFLPSLEAQNPWGNDESGKKFAEGEKGYLKYSKDTLDVLKGMPDALKGIADGLKAMAQGYQGADEAIAADFDGMDTGASSLPPPPSLSSAPVNNPVHIPVTPRIIQSGRH